MSTEMSLFSEGNPLVNSDLFKSLQDTNDRLAGGGGTYRRISIKGGKFREILNGEQVNVSKSDTMNVVIIDAAPVARTYYEGSYDPDSKPVPPTCWSADTEAPHPDVENPQATRCADCPQNIKGSGQGNSRACRFSQRLAIAVEDKLDTIYQFQLPATSIFGDGTDRGMPMQSYARLLKAHKTPVIAVVTEMKFDEDAEVPKLFFRPLRPLAEDELNEAVALRETPETKHALELTVSQTDGVLPPPADDTKVPDATVTDLFPEGKKEEKKAKPKAIKDDKVPEPSKAVKKKSGPVPDDGEDLSAVIEEWDDGDAEDL